MNVLFLDMDGVLNSKGDFLLPPVHRSAQKDGEESSVTIMLENMNQWNVDNLVYALKALPDLQIVISSAWRKHFSLADFKATFNIVGLPSDRLLGFTPAKLSSSRASEVRMWLDENPAAKSIAVVDDHVVFDLEDPMKQREVLTNPWTGFTMHDAESLIQLFDNSFKLPEVLI